MTQGKYGLLAKPGLTSKAMERNYQIYDLLGDGMDAVDDLQ
jgi:hypothetical protein